MISVFMTTRSPLNPCKIGSRGLLKYGSEERHFNGVTPSFSYSFNLKQPSTIHQLQCVRGSYRSQLLTYVDCIGCPHRVTRCFYLTSERISAFSSFLLLLCAATRTYTVLLVCFRYPYELASVKFWPE